MKKIVRIDKRYSHKSGFSFVELLVSIAIFGVIIVALSSMLVSTNKVSQGQSNAAHATMAARKSLLRITDLVTQAHYIYPAGQTIELNLATGGTKNIQTGPNALAILLPEGTTYCPGAGQSYCGYVISIEDRNMFANILVNSEHTSEFALVGWRAFNLSWEREDIPAIDISIWNAVREELLIDSVIPDSQANGSDLASFARLDVSKVNTSYDNDHLFSNLPEDRDQANCLIASIEPKIIIAYGSSSGDKRVERSSHIFARAVPRANQPNPN